MGTEGVESVEKAAVDFLRRKHGLVCDNPELEKKHRATNKRRLASSKPELAQKARKVVSTMVIEDSEDED